MSTEEMSIDAAHDPRLTTTAFEGAKKLHISAEEAALMVEGSMQVRNRNRCLLKRGEMTDPVCPRFPKATTSGVSRFRRTVTLAFRSWSWDASFS